MIPAGIEMMNQASNIHSQTGTSRARWRVIAECAVVALGIHHGLGLPAPHKPCVYATAGMYPEPELLGCAIYVACVVQPEQCRAAQRAFAEVVAE